MEQQQGREAGEIERQKEYAELQSAPNGKVEVDVGREGARILVEDVNAQDRIVARFG